MKYIWRFIIFLAFLFLLPLLLASLNILYFMWNLELKEKWKDIFSPVLTIDSNSDETLDYCQKYIYPTAFDYLLNKKVYYKKKSILSREWVLDLERNEKN